MEFYIPYGKKNGLIVCKDDMKLQPLSYCRAVVANYNEKGDVNIWSECYGGMGILLPWGKYVLMIMNEKDGETGQQLYDRMTGTDNEPGESEEETPSYPGAQWKHTTYEKP